MNGSLLKNPWAGIYAVLTVLGGGFMIATLVMGQKLFGSTDSVPWNILVATYAFLAGAAAGTFFFTTLGEALGLGMYRFLSRTGTVAALAALLAALVTIGVELGRPLGAVLFLVSPNFSSPMWWMAITYLTLLVVMVVRLWALGKGNMAVSKLTAYAGLVLSLAAPLVLGQVFGNLIARPLWFGSLTPVYFLALALALGAAGVLLLGAVSGEGDLQMLGWVMTALVAVLGGVLAFKLSGADVRYAAVIKSGPLSTYFWAIQVGLGLAVPVVLAITPLVKKPLFAILAAVSVFAGALTARILDVVAGQAFPVMANLPFKAYKVTTAEVAIVAGVVGMAGLLYLVFSAYTNKAASNKAAA